MDPKRLVKTSKHLSKVLRHQPESVGLTLDDAGWIEVDKLLAAMSLSKADLDAVVADNNKKRFEYSADGLSIRASQGHSVDVDLGYEAKEPPATLYHGTFEAAVESILQSGLEKRDRHHVHLSADLSTAVSVGSRRGKPCVFDVAAGDMHRDGFKFFVSTNGVWLTDAVPAKYLTRRAP